VLLAATRDVSGPSLTGYAKSGDLSIAYQVIGDGPFDIVFVPGFVSHLDLGWELGCPADASTDELWPASNAMPPIPDGTVGFADGAQRRVRRRRGGGVVDTGDIDVGSLVKQLRVKPGSKVTLAEDFDPGSRGGFVKKQDGARLLEQGVQLLGDYQQRLAAQDSYGLLVVLQGIDAAGKDGTIRHVMTGVDPQGVEVHSFKVPSAEELDHDYLWRCAQRLPARGKIGIFNRSYYEEVLVVRVHPENLDREHLPADAKRDGVWKRRYREINDWERYLSDNGFRIVKLFLNLSKEEQRQRFLRRIALADHNWKFSADDAKERSYWDDYQEAFSGMLTSTSSELAPWFVIPADHKWFARICAAAVIVHALMEIDPRYPILSEADKRALREEAARLEAEAPNGSRSRPRSHRSSDLR
jgi:PPK2 family polyphosphate:nucleotide phosphotransferase